MKRKLALLVASVVCVSSIAAANSAPTADLFPLKSGNFWTYKVTDPRGKMSQSKWVVSAAKEKSGRPLFKLSSGDTVKVYSKRDGRTYLERIEYPGKPADGVEFTPAKLVIDTNIRMDNVWKWNGKRSRGNAENEHWQTFPNEKVRVPAGEFECVRVGGLSVRDGVMVYQTRWFAKNIGVIKSLDVQGSQKTLEELLKYRVN
ncbi:MAG: hypothetical protein K2Y39_16565 [Candidatus Obscuribacterales bacterium]|nr:hypothetical protein [Candidatus Obscuribacterales bacterium]